MRERANGKVVVQHAYAAPARPEGIVFDEHASRTKQEFKKECDINVLMKKYERLGTLPQNVSVAKYGDFSEASDFMEAQNVILRAREQFESLPSSARERFKNDPARFLAFVKDKANAEEARKLGLLKDVVVPPPPMEVRIVSDPNVVAPVVPTPVPPVAK